MGKNVSGVKVRALKCPIVAALGTQVPSLNSQVGNGDDQPVHQTPEVSVQSREVLAARERLICSAVASESAGYGLETMVSILEPPLVYVECPVAVRNSEDGKSIGVDEELRGGAGNLSQRPGMIQKEQMVAPLMEQNIDQSVVIE